MVDRCFCLLRCPRPRRRAAGHQEGHCRAGRADPGQQGRRGDPAGGADCRRRLQGGTAPAAADLRKLWQPEVIPVSALAGDGLDQVWSAIERHAAALEAAGEKQARRAAQAQAALWADLGDGLIGALKRRPAIAGAYSRDRSPGARRRHDAYGWCAASIGAVPRRRRLAVAGINYDTGRSRHCERSEAIQPWCSRAGLLRCARNDVSTFGRQFRGMGLLSLQCGRFPGRSARPERRSRRSSAGAAPGCRSGRSATANA